MRVAIVGCGQFADAHVQEARKIPGVEVVSVCDLNVHMAHQVAIRFGIPSHYTDVGTMLRESKPDVVHITTPPSTHLPIGRMAIKHGCHVYVEKPFVITASEAEELIDAAVRHGKLICVGHSSAFDEAFLRLKDMHRDGSLGEVVHVDAYMGYDLTGAFGSVIMGDPDHWVHGLPGGLAHNNISHPLSLMLEFIDDDNPRISAMSFRKRERRFGDIRDRFADELRVFIGGKSSAGTLLFSAHTRPVQLYVVVHGSRCQAIANLDSRTLRVVKGANLPGPFRKVQWAARDTKEARREYRRHLADLVGARLHFFQGLNSLITRFYSAIEGKGPMPIPMQEAYRTTAIMDDIFKQCRQHYEQETTEVTTS